MKKGGCDYEKSHPPYFICIFLVFSRISSYIPCW